MLFRRLILNALLVGLLAGLVLSLVQILAVNPIIFAAETFEVAEPVEVTGAHAHASDGHDHVHDSEAWAPEDGWERTGFTVLSNVLAATGFASVLLACMSILQLLGVTRVNVGKGVLWGIAGFTAFFLAPAVGLPPEIPGVEAAALESRQLWWLAAVGGVGLGILMLFFAPRYVKILGALAIATPYLMPIPHLDGPAFTHPDPAAVLALTDLHQQFIVASGAVNLLFWVVMGALAAWAFNRFVLPAVPAKA